MSAATSLYAAQQQVSLTLGVSVGARRWTVAMAVSGHQRPGLDDFSAGFLVVSAISLLGAPVSLLMSRTAGAELSGQAVPGRPRAA